MTRSWRWVRPVAGIAIAATFLYLLLSRIDRDAAADAIRSAAAGPLVLALIALAAGFGVRIVRWWWMLRALDPALPLRNCARPFLVSLAINNTVPLRAGDIYRAVGFRSALRASPMAVLGTLVVERLLDLFVLLTLFFVGLAGVAAGAVPPAFVAAGTALGVAALVALLVLMLAPHRLRAMLAAARARWATGSRPLLDRVAAAGDEFLAGLAATGSVARTLLLLGLSIVAWAFEGSVFVLVAMALGADVAAMGPWFALATGTLATLIPSSPGYVGTFDFFAMRGLVAYGADATTAAAFSIVVHLLLWIPVTLVGGALLVASPRRGTPSSARGIESV